MAQTACNPSHYTNAPPKRYVLSDPKPIPAGFVGDRRSIYWKNGFPLKDSKFALLTRRQTELVGHKKCHPDYLPSLASPIWTPSPYALHAMPSRRVMELARPKKDHAAYKPQKLEESAKVRSSALFYHPSKRISWLAQPKYCVTADGKYKENSDWCPWNEAVNVGMIPSPSARVLNLAEPKAVSESYVPPRLDHSVSKEAMSYTATERIGQLSRPKNKHLETEDYDPKTYSVSRSALMAQASPRLTELATPLPRKVRTKKN